MPKSRKESPYKIQELQFFPKSGLCSILRNYKLEEDNEKENSLQCERKLTIWRWSLLWCMTPWILWAICKHYFRTCKIYIMQKANVILAKRTNFHHQMLNFLIGYCWIKLQKNWFKTPCKCCLVYVNTCMREKERKYVT